MGSSAYDGAVLIIRLFQVGEVERIPQNVEYDYDREKYKVENRFDNAVQGVEGVPQDIGRGVDDAARWSGDKVSSAECVGNSLTSEHARLAMLSTITTARSTRSRIDSIMPFRTSRMCHRISEGAQMMPPGGRETRSETWRGSIKASKIRTTKAETTEDREMMGGKLRI